MMSWLAIGVLVLLIATTLHQLYWHVLPGLAHLRQREVLLDVWLPVAIVAPFTFSATRIEASVHGAGWNALGAPIILATLGISISLLGAGERFDPFDESELRHSASVGLLGTLRMRCIGASALAGTTLLMLAAAHVMHVWIGQASFALAAVLLWINTPDPQGSYGSAPDQPSRTAGWAMLSVVLLAAGQGAAIGFVEPGQFTIASLLMIAHAAAALTMIATVAAPGLAGRVGLWCAPLGLLFSLGTLSLAQVLPRAMDAALRHEFETPPESVAYGFGAYAVEATLLLTLAFLAILLSRTRTPVHRSVGALLLLAAVALTVWRTLQMPGE